MLSKNFFLAIAILIVAGFSALGQGGGKIKGTVKDSNGAVVTGATVTALNIASSQRKTVTTDGSGNYQFTGLRGGTYRVIATSNGFNESAETIVLEDGGSVSQDFSIAPGGIKDVVTVTAGKGSDRVASEIPQTVTVTSSEQIEQRVPRSTFEAMERAPNLGAIETNPARERPRLRGLSSTRLLVVVDGEKLNNARSDPGASGAPIAVIDPSQLESVEVVAGSGSSLYGSDSIGGTINLVTKRPTLSPDGLILGLRLDGSYNSNGAVRRGNATLNLSGSNVALRASSNMYRLRNYNMGNGELTIAENLRFGNFFRQFPTTVGASSTCANAICFQSAASYPIFALPKNAEILNGQGHGVGEQIDLWFFPVQKHSFRGRYLNRDDGNNGNAFSGPPYETQERYGSYRSFRKWGIRYEGLDLNKYIPRVSVNYFYQKLSFPQNQYTFNNAAGGSFNTNANPNLTSFTGNPSTFTAGSYTDNRNSIDTEGVDLQASVLPLTGLVVTVGGGRTKDKSRDYFFVSNFTGFGPARTFTGTATIGASSPVSNYVDNNFYAQAEFDKIKYVRFSGGMRFDNWKTEGLPGNGFPLSTEFATLNAAIPGLQANPGALTSLVSALPGLVALAGGTGKSSSNRNSTTYNFGIVGRLPWGVNPYFRWANSYREPGITERYLIRNFTPGVPGLASLVVGNPNLKPEKGQNYDAGIKISQQRFNFTLGYFHNKITDLLAFAPAQTYCVAPVPGAPGGFAGGCGTQAPNNLGVQVNARINFASATIKGWESTGEGSIPLGSFGSLNPFYSLGSLHGTNGSPTDLQIAQLNAVYNKSTNPIPLEGSVGDFPLGNITPFRILYGAQYLDNKGRIFVEYNVRHQNRVKRADPGQFVGTALINYGSFASTNAFDKHSIKGGYNWKNDKYKFSINAGIDNIADKLFFEHFQNAPAPGRSFVFGFAIEAFNLLKR
ncbi:MAG: TonB-dependent receptor [Pyrinomonadaceae bacterium]|nr:TonB-dependent receptor [Pyrinomonadaceae bacterium]